MGKDNRILHWVVGAICAAVAGAMGAISGREVGGVLGVVNGLAVGYWYVELSLRIPERSRLVRILKGTGYGAVAGAVSGGLVHLPSILMPGSSMNDLSMIPVGAVFGVVLGTPFGLLLSLIICFIPARSAPERGRETSPAAAPPPERTGPGELTPEDGARVMDVYPALKEHDLFDQHTALAYWAKAGGNANKPELENRYARALAWLQERRPGFTQEDWVSCNASAHKMVRFLVARRGGGTDELARLCPGLGEEVRAWLARSAGLFL